MTPTASHPGRQLLFPFQDASGLRFDNFRVEGNGVIVESCRELAQGRRTGLLVLHGPAGSGKSHLLRASCEACIAAHGRAALWVAQSHPTRIQPLPVEEGLPFDLLALDGIEVLAGDAIREEACFHLVLAALQGRLRLLMAGRASPQALSWNLPDLASRLRAATLPALKPLNDESRLYVLRERSAMRGMELEEAAARWLLHHWPRDLESLLAVLDRLEGSPGAIGRRISLPFLKRALDQEPPTS